jgi:hypothetical protein
VVAVDLAVLPQLTQQHKELLVVFMVVVEVAMVITDLLLVLMVP